jgi:predicted nuclease with TOPRIM domain
MQKQIATREAPSHLTEKINVLITENELLLNKIKELENVVGDVQLLKTEMQRLREKNSSDWNYWRKQQSDLYAQLRQQQFIKESILNKFDRLQKQVMKSIDGNDRLLRDISVGPISLNSFQNEPITKSSLSNLSIGIELPHEIIEDSSVPINDNDKQQMFKKSYSAQENTATSLEEVFLFLYK